MTGKKSIVFSVLMGVAGIAILAGYMFVVTPTPIRVPKLDHAHIRMALYVNGSSIDFGSAPFQKQSQAVCTDELSEDPIHFHDRKNNFVHLHWEGITGGLVLKNYGWNLIGGPNSLLGYRADRLPMANQVPIYGDVLPVLPAGAALWVYTGGSDSFILRDSQSFLNQDFETFFGRKSSVGAVQPDFWRDLLFVKASAHEGHNRGTKTQAELTQINNLLGDVVIFAQASKPIESDIRDAFTKLEPLTESTCGG